MREAVFTIDEKGTVGFSDTNLDKLFGPEIKNGGFFSREGAHEVRLCALKSMSERKKISDGDIRVLGNQRVSMVVTPSMSSKEVMIKIKPRRTLDLPNRSNASAQNFAKLLDEVIFSVSDAESISKLEECKQFVHSNEPLIPDLYDQEDFVQEFIFSEFSKSRSPSTGSRKSSSEALSSPGRISIAREVSGDIYEQLRSWDLDTLDIESTKLIQWAVAIFKETGLVNLFQLDVSKLVSFLLDLSKNYRENPFHNFTHGFTVFQATFLLMQRQQYDLRISDTDLFGLLIAAISHDVDHRGRTNAFEINTQCELALLYNDQSVLEQHHSALTFRLLTKRSNNFLEPLSTDQLRRVRTVIIESILATDMAKHFEKVSKFKQHEPVQGDPDVELLGYILHCADLSNPVRPFEISEKWTMLCGKEFEEQIDEERARGLPITSHLLAETQQQFVQREVNFLRFIVHPLWKELSCKMNVDDRMIQLESNLQIWEQRLE